MPVNTNNAMDPQNIQRSKFFGTPNWTAIIQDTTDMPLKSEKDDSKIENLVISFFNPSVISNFFPSRSRIPRANNNKPTDTAPSNTGTQEGTGGSIQPSNKYINRTQNRLDTAAILDLIVGLLTIMCDTDSEARFYLMCFHSPR